MPDTPDRSLRAVLTVTVETRPDGGHYFGQADFTAHATEWVRAALKGQHAVDDVTIVDQAAELARAQAEAHQYRTALQGVARSAAPVPPSAPTDQAAILREAEAALRAQGKHLAGEFNDSDILHEDGPASAVATWQRAADLLRRMAVEAPAPNRAGDETPSSTAPLAAGFPLVKGNCPACRRASLFLGSGGYVTCSLVDCPEPDAATTVLERRMADEAQQPETQQGPPRPPSPRCAHCRHPKRDHDGRADHRAKSSPLVAGDPWCHACNAECDYAEQPGFQDRGDAARLAAGIDGTAGDAQDIPHRFVVDEPTGGCLLCGLAPTYRKHTSEQRHARAFSPPA